MSMLAFKDYKDTVDFEIGYDVAEKLLRTGRTYIVNSEVLSRPGLVAGWNTCIYQTCRSVVPKRVPDTPYNIRG